MSGNGTTSKIAGRACLLLIAWGLGTGPTASVRGSEAADFVCELIDASRARATPAEVGVMLPQGTRFWEYPRAEG